MRLFSATAILVMIIPLWMVTYLGGGTVEEDVYQPYVQVLVGKGGYGSGVVIEVKGKKYILTAGHCVSDCFPSQDFRDDETPLRFTPCPIHIMVGKQKVKCAVVYYSPVEEEGGTDLAILEPYCANNLKPARWCPEMPVKVGDDAWYVGSPWKIQGLLERSIVAKTDATLGYSCPMKDHEFYLLNGCGWFGNSGGPVFIKKEDAYYLIGIVTRLYVYSERSPIMAQKRETLSSFLEAFEKSLDR